jgi:hypothetical protein
MRICHHFRANCQLLNPVAASPDRLEWHFISFKWSTRPLDRFTYMHAYKPQVKPYEQDACSDRQIHHVRTIPYQALLTKTSQASTTH